MFFSMLTVFSVALLGTVLGLGIVGLNSRRGYLAGLHVAHEAVRWSRSGEEAMGWIRKLADPPGPRSRIPWPDAERAGVRL